MSIINKVSEVNKLFDSLENEVSELKKATGIHCIDNCVHCCTTPKIMATTLEFYPMALHLYKTGKAETVLNKVQSINKNTICPLLNIDSSNGNRIGCTQYQNRGMICRLFTFNHATDKHGLRKISTCRIMKLAQPDEISKTNAILKEKPIGPNAIGYYAQLQSIDFIEGQNFYPIAEAVKMALEKVLTYYYYNNEEE